MTFDTEDPPEGNVKGASEVGEDAADGITINEVTPEDERLEALEEKRRDGTITETEYAEHGYLDILRLSLDEVPDDPTIEGLAERLDKDPQQFHDELEMLRDRND